MLSQTSRLFRTIHGWLCRPRGFFEAKALSIGVFYGKDGERLMIDIERPPRVILVTDKALRLWDPEAPMLEELGYVRYEKNVLFQGSYYALRPWVYLIKGTLWFRARWWWFVTVTHKRLWHSHQEGGAFRWQDMRLGPGRLCQAQTVAREMQSQIQNQYMRIGKLEGERESAYAKGLDQGWEDHTKVAEKYIDDRLHSG